jgi:integrase
MLLRNTRMRFIKAGDRPVRITDGQGLSLEVRPSGALLWRYRYRLAGKENIFAIGSYPELSLQDARKARDAARKLVERGIHPAHHRRAERLRRAGGEAETLEAAARRWLEQKESRWTPRTHRQRERLLERDVFPAIGALPLRGVSPAQVEDLLGAVRARAPQMAVLASQCLAAIYRSAVADGRADVDIVSSLSGTARRPAARAPLILRPAEIPGFFAALRCYRGHFQTKAAVRLLWLTLLRPQQVLEARWEEVDEETRVWTLPAGRLRPGEARQLPLSAQASELLSLLRGVSGTGVHVIPNRGDPRRHASHSILVKALSNMGYAGRLTPLGIRQTGRKILGDRLEPRAGGGNRLAPRRAMGASAPPEPGGLAARREVLQRWADYLDGLGASEHALRG